MGTRGAYGFRIDGTDKVTYNHFDSYPGYLGQHILEYIAARTPEQLRAVAERIVLVREEEPPTAEQQQRLARFADTGVSTGKTDEWYVLLRNAQGNLSVYDDPDFDVMIDSHTFLADSLFCEYAYIINVDEGTLEFYRGFNKSPDGAGRYASLVDGGEAGKKRAIEIHGYAYYGVTLLKEYPLAEIVGADELTIKRLADEMEKLSSWDEEAE